MCNGHHTRNLFPLEDPAVRNCADRRVADGPPLLIDPSPCDPGEQFRFKFDLEFGITDVGRIIIDSLRLNREKLVESRRGWLQYFVLL